MVHSKCWHHLSHCLPICQNSINRKYLLVYSRKTSRALTNKVFSFSSYTASRLTLRNSMLKCIATALTFLYLEKRWSLLYFEVDKFRGFIFDDSPPESRCIDAHVYWFFSYIVPWTSEYVLLTCCPNTSHFLEMKSWRRWKKIKIVELKRFESCEKLRRMLIFTVEDWMFNFEI